MAKSYFKQNYCHACHTRFSVFFPLPSCCVSSLIKSPGQLYCLVPLFLILLTIMLQNYQPPFMMLKLTLASILIACFLLTITKARTFHRHHYQDAEPHGRVPFKRFFLKVGITQFLIVVKKPPLVARYLFQPGLPYCPSLNGSHNWL